MILLAAMCTFLLRINMSINLLAMTTETLSALKLQDGPECLKRAQKFPKNHTRAKMKLPDVSTVLIRFDFEVLSFQYGPRYDWNPKVQGLILGSPFWGVMLTSIPGGLLAEKFGSVETIGISTLLASAVTILFPIASAYHFGYVVAIRFVLGLLGVRLRFSY